MPAMLCRGTGRTPLRFLILLGLLLLTLPGCGEEQFTPCKVSLLGIRPAGSVVNSLFGFLPGQPGESELPAVLVKVRVTNPNDRGITITGLSGGVFAPDGEIGAFSLPAGRTVELPANGSAVAEVMVSPHGEFLRHAPELLLSPKKRAELTATGYVDVSTWLGTRRVNFKNVRLMEDERTKDPPAPPAKPGTAA